MNYLKILISLFLLVLLYNSCDNTVSNEKENNHELLQLKDEKSTSANSKHKIVMFRDNDGNLIEYWEKIKFINCDLLPLDSYLNLILKK